jgi:crotonobetainyl-CoA:carnitine CoA-transferase CaiB-like acyl-CoA transferase
MAPPYRLDGERLPVRRAPPELGEGTRDVLSSLLGLGDERLAELKALGVV